MTDAQILQEARQMAAEFESASQSVALDIAISASLSTTQLDKGAATLRALVQLVERQQAKIDDLDIGLQNLDCIVVAQQKQIAGLHAMLPVREAPNAD